jgi:hypothetical protein
MARPRREFRETYDAAQQYGLDEGLLQPGENSRPRA